MSISLTINTQPGPGIQIVFYRERDNRQLSVYPELNNQKTFHQLCLKAMNVVSHSKCLLVQDSEAAMNILTGITNLLCCCTLRRFCTTTWQVAV